MMCMCLLIYLSVYLAYDSTFMQFLQLANSQDVLSDYALDFDTLNINAIPHQMNELGESSDETLTHCEDLLEYVIKVKGGKNEKLTALLDTGCGFSAIKANVAEKYKQQKSPYSIQCGLAATEANEVTINKIPIDKHVKLDFKIGNYNDSYCFRVFPNLQADVILGLDWLAYHNPKGPNWKTGVMYLHKNASQNSKSSKNLFKIKPVKPVKPLGGQNMHSDKKQPNNKQTDKAHQDSGCGLISAKEVSKSQEWECMMLMVKTTSDGEKIEEDEEDYLQFYKPHFEEPPLYKQSDPLTEQQKQMLEDLKRQNHDVLKVTLPKGIPPHRKGDTPIAPTPPGVKPIKKSAYLLSPWQNLEIKRQLTEYIDKGYLQPSHSPWGAPVFLVKKPHSDLWRMVCDWRGLNKLTIKDRFEIPNPALLFDKLGGAKWFTKLDLAQGYHQIPLCEDDRHKSAIVTRYGSYEWTVASFGMTNVPSVFQRVLGNVLFEYTDNFVVNFFDDILVYTKDSDLNTHIKHIQLVLNKLKEAQLYCNPEKCTWFATSLSYLGFEISAEGIRCSKEKVQTVSDWPIPTTVKQVKQFLGLCSYYRKFIDKFAHISTPLHALTKGYKKQKNASHRLTTKWLPEHQLAFEALKNKLITHPVLRWPDFTKPFILIPDASGFAIGGVLAQEHEDGIHPVAYESRVMNKAEQRYPVHEQELLAILHCSKKFRHYIIGQTSNTVLTDHAPLQYLHTQPHLSNRQARWLDFLAEYNLHIQPIKGVDNVPGDSMSRIPVNTNTYMMINNNSVMCCNIKASEYFHKTIDHVFYKYQNHVENHTSELQETTVNAIISCTTLEESQLYKNISLFYQEDVFVQPLVTRSQKFIPAKTGKYVLLNNLVYFVTHDERYLLYIPEAAVMPNSKISLRQQILQEAHDSLYAGHFGTQKTLYKLQQQFFWPKIHIDVADYCRSCVPCQRNKPSNRKPLGLLQPMPVAYKPWQTISMDFITKLPKSVEGFDSVMVVVDQLTKRAHFIPTTTDISAAGVAHLFFNNIWKYHGLPSKIISDRDSKFTAKFWQTLWSLLGTKLAMSTAYSPQTDGQTERLNRTLEEYIRSYIDPITNNWSQLLAPAEYAYNNAKHTSTGFSPFELDCGQRPSDPLFMFTAAANQHSHSNRVINTLEDFLQQMTILWDRARNALLITQENQKKFYDTKHRQEEFFVGDEVFLSTLRDYDYGQLKYASQETGSTPKFEPRYLGPFKIISKPSSHAYELDLPPSMQIHPVIHIRYLLRPRTAKLFPDRIVEYRKPPELVEGELEYHVEKILKKRIRKYGKGSRVEYLVHWRGYPAEEDTWEPLRNLTHCADLLNEFNARLQQHEVNITCIFVV